MKNEKKCVEWNQSMERSKWKFTLNDASFHSSKCQLSISEHCPDFFKNRALGTVGKMMNIKIIELRELIKFFNCRKEGNYFCTQDIGVISEAFIGNVAL